MKARLSRRKFLELGSAAIAGGALFRPPETSAAPAAADIPASSTRLTSGWQYSPGGLGGAWEARPNVRDSRTWHPVDVPHCVNALDGVDPDTRFYQGLACYRRSLEVQNPYPDGRTLLHFEGAGQRAELYVFTEKVGTHEGGYDEFTIDITEAVARYRKVHGPGAVPIVVVCDNSRDPDMVPSSLADFTVYGGLYRNVHLVYVPGLSIERLHVASTLRERQAQVSVRARLYDPTATGGEATVQVRVLGPDGKVVHEDRRRRSTWAGMQEVAAFSIPAPALWSPRTPHLYTCVLNVRSRHGEHTTVERFGLRTFEFPAKAPFTLNGERLFLRGTHRHEDHAGLGAAMTDELIRKEMALIKDLGANFIRLGHYQQSRLVLDLCDELGLLVWEEIPWCRGSLNTDRAKEHVREKLRNLIDQHYNHPSIVLWGLGNEVAWPEEAETFDQEAVRSIVRGLASLAKELDPSRKTALRRTEYCADLVDVFAPSIWAGWYSGRYTEYKPSAERLVKEIPSHVFHAEWGGDSHPGRHTEDPDKLLAQIASGDGVAERGLDYLLSGGQARASRDGDWSETYICNLFDWYLKEQETMRDWFSGSAQWVFKDFSTPHRGDNPVPLVNQKGLVERDLTPKEGYFVFQSYWSERPMIRIYSHSWPVRWGAAGEEKMIKVYSNCPSVELFVNGVSRGRRQRDPQDFPAAGLRWMVKLEAGENHVRAVGVRDGVTVSDEIRFQYHTEGWGAPAKLVLSEGPREGDVVTARAALVDANGRTCLDARVFVRFDLAGDGTLLANLGTAAGARKVQLANGTAQIRARLGAGTAVISVASAGVPTALLEIRR